MACAHIQEWRNAEPGFSNYDAVSAKLDVANNPPEGLIALTVGRDPQGIARIFSIWESREQVERFIEERLMPTVQETMQERRGEGGPPDVSEIYDLHDFVLP